MRHHLISIAMAPSSSSSSSSSSSTANHHLHHHHHHHHHHHNHLNNTNKKLSSSPSSSSSSSNPNPGSCTNNCSHHSPSATLDILILVVVLFSGAFLVSSYFSYIFHSLSLILPRVSLSTTITLIIDSSSLYLIGFFLFFVLSIVGFEICCGNRSRKCGKKGCKGLKKAMEFDLQLQTEDILRSGAKGVKEMEELPWKGGSETNPDYECLRTELRKMAPINGRAVLLFRSKCGCPVAKLEGWGPKRGRRNKKSLALNGGDTRT